jgi:hypothetical protein
MATETADWPQCCRIRPPLPTMPRGAAKTLRADCVDACESCLQYSSSCLDHLASCMKRKEKVSVLKLTKLSVLFGIV